MSHIASKSANQAGKEAGYSWIVQRSSTHFRLIRVEHDAASRAGPKRKDALLMSAGARRRVMYALNRIDFSYHVNRTFLTFGFPDEIDCFSYKQRTYWRNRFHAEIERLLRRRVPLLWRQEWTRRKSGKRLGETMPHYHCLFLDLPFIKQATLASLWTRILQSYEKQCIVDVRRVYNEDGAIRYVAKYVSKLPSLDICPYLDKRMKTGRSWGIRRNNLIVKRPMVESFLEDQGKIDALLAFADMNLRRPKEAGRQGFTLYGDLAKLAIAFLGDSP